MALIFPFLKAFYYEIARVTKQKYFIYAFNTYYLGYEWKSAYREKEALMLERGYPEVSPHDFYRELFPAGSLQQEPEDGKGNIIATQIRPSGKGRTRQWVIDDSLKMLDKVIGDRFGLIPPISFYGKSHTKENAHELFAVVVDVDYVGKQQLKNLLKQFGNGVQLRPTYLVSSGKGVHLYYFLQEPVQLYRNREEVLAELKEAFIRRLWNDTSSIRPDSPDITGIYQGFRCVGSQSKLGVDFPVKAYKLSENRYTLEDIKASIPSCKVDLAPLYEKPRRKSTVTLEEAKELYPEWYEKRIVQGEPKQKSKKQGGTWVCNEALYEWWKRKITEEVKAGGRYFSIMALCSYGLKCGISEQKIRRDAYAFLDHLESLTEDEDNTKVTIPANKRNYRKQKDHVKVMNTMKALKKQLGEEVKEGRPKGSGTAEQTVREWQESHPAGKKADCIRETGLSKPTVYKWWK
ncbi:repa [Campylobacter jejuni]|nr:repa [Campylobacter jejuni]